MKSVFVFALIALAVSANLYEQIAEELKEVKSQHVLKELLGELKDLIKLPKKEVKPEIPHYVKLGFKGFKEKFGKTYADAKEEEYRLRVFFDNLKFIEEFYQGEKQTFTIGITEFTDLTHEEFKKQYVGGLMVKPLSERKPKILSTDNLAATVDWRTKGIVNPVKNQEQCGSCWAFSAVAAMEGAYAQKHGTLKSFSEQQLVDCSKKFHNNGCNGGLMDYAFKYAEQNKMELESDYPYVARTNFNCKAMMTKGVFNTVGYTDVQHNSPQQLMAALNHGVVSIAIEADQRVFQHYTGGVITQSTCGQRLDHGVAAVGYTANSFIVRNSWGPTWGDHGYVQISNSPMNICGILSAPSWPTVN